PAKTKGRTGASPAAFLERQQARVFQCSRAVTDTCKVFGIGRKCHECCWARLLYQHCRIPALILGPNEEGTASSKEQQFAAGLLQRSEEHTSELQSRQYLVC